MNFADEIWLSPANNGLTQHPKITIAAESFRRIPLVIEWLNVTVHPNLRERYVQQDEAIWTPVLARYPGFLGKEVWISPDDLSNVILIVRWATFKAWQAVPQAVLDETEAAFQQAMGGNTYQITDSNRYQVRKYG